MRALEYYSKNNNLWNSAGAVYKDSEGNNSTTNNNNALVNFFFLKCKCCFIFKENGKIFTIKNYLIRKK